MDVEEGVSVLKQRQYYIHTQSCARITKGKTGCCFHEINKCHMNYTHGENIESMEGYKREQKHRRGHDSSSLASL